MAALLLLASPLLAPAAPAALTATPIPVKWWDIDAAVQAQQLTYEEQALAFTLQGLANKRSAGQPTLMFKAGFLDFDWPDADGWWRGELEAAGRVAYTNLTATLCGLVEGAVMYENANSSGTGYTLAMALTLASQQSLLPVTETLLAKHACLSKFKVAEDLRIALEELAAWVGAHDDLKRATKQQGDEHNRAMAKRLAEHERTLNELTKVQVR